MSPVNRRSVSPNPYIATYITITSIVVTIFESENTVSKMFLGVITWLTAGTCLASVLDKSLSFSIGPPSCPDPPLTPNSESRKNRIPFKYSIRLHAFREKFRGTRLNDIPRLIPELIHILKLMEMDKPQDVYTVIKWISDDTQMRRVLTNGCFQRYYSGLRARLPSLCPVSECEESAKLLADEMKSEARQQEQNQQTNTKKSSWFGPGPTTKKKITPRVVDEVYDQLYRSESTESLVRWFITHQQKQTAKDKPAVISPPPKQKETKLTKAKIQEEPYDQVHMSESSDSLVRWFAAYQQKPAAQDKNRRATKKMNVVCGQQNDPEIKPKTSSFAEHLKLTRLNNKHTDILSTQ